MGGARLPDIMDETPDSQGSEQQEAAKKTRKLYQKPSFRYERVFETTALACMKAVATLKTCKSHNKS